MQYSGLGVSHSPTQKIFLVELFDTPPFEVFEQTNFPVKSLSQAPFPQTTPSGVFIATPPGYAQKS